MKYYGFVYLWRDRLRKMSYIGSHVGLTSDSYKGSSTRFQRAYAKRPDDFRRKILIYVIIEDRKTLLQEEERWLQMIKPEHLQLRYYNIKRRGTGGNTIEGYDASQQKAYKQKLRNRPGKGSSHYKARAVVCEGIAYDTLTIAKKMMKWDPTRRLRSRRFAEFYFLDEGPPSQEEIQLSEFQKSINKRRSIDAMAKRNHELDREYHQKRTAKSTASRIANGNTWSKPLAERQGTQVTIDDRTFLNLKHASKVTGISIPKIRKRYLFQGKCSDAASSRGDTGNNT